MAIESNNKGPRPVGSQTVTRLVGGVIIPVRNIRVAPSGERRAGDTSVATRTAREPLFSRNVILTESPVMPFVDVRVDKTFFTRISFELYQEEAVFGGFHRFCTNPEVKSWPLWVKVYGYFYCVMDRWVQEDLSIWEMFIEGLIVLQEGKDEALQANVAEGVVSQLEGEVSKCFEHATSVFGVRPVVDLRPSNLCKMLARVFATVSMKPLIPCAVGLSDGIVWIRDYTENHAPRLFHDPAIMINNELPRPLELEGALLGKIERHRVECGWDVYSWSMMHGSVVPDIVTNIDGFQWNEESGAWNNFLEFCRLPEVKPWKTWVKLMVFVFSNLDQMMTVVLQEPYFDFLSTYATYQGLNKHVDHETGVEVDFLRTMSVVLKGVADNNPRIDLLLRSVHSPLDEQYRARYGERGNLSRPE